MGRNRLPLKPGMLKRERIDELLNAGLDYPLVTIVGGPGYGKTQVVAQFVQGIRPRVIWLNLTRMDNNSEHFWNTLVSSIGHELPHFSAVLQGHEFPGTIREFDRHLIEAAGALEFVEETVFVIDNFSVIEEGPVRVFLETLIEVQLARLCIFLISNNLGDQEYVEGLVGRDCLEVTPDTLRFTEEEADLLFKSHGIEIDPAGLARVMEETEGWPLAVYLMCRQCLKSRTTLERALAARLPVLDRLFDNGFFQAYTPGFRNMLIGFAFLPSFSLDMAQDFQAEQRAQFAECVMGNVFITYDCNSKTFTFHPMYQDFLRRKRFAVSDAEMAKIYRHAGDWFHASARFLEAVDCYYNCACYTEMTRAILMLPVVHRDAATTNYLLSYMEKLPASYLETAPEARFCMALLYVNRMEIRRSRALLLGVEKQLKAQPAPEQDAQLLGETYAMLADISFMMNDSECFAYFPKAAELLTEGSRFHSRSTMHVGNNNTLYIPGERAGLLQETVERVLGIVPYTESYMRGEAYGAAHLFAAEAAYAVCNIALARENCHRAIFQALKEEQHDIVCNAYFLQMRCAVYEGDNGGVKQALRSLESYCGKHKLDILGELHDNARGWLYIRLGLLELAPRWIAEYDNDRYTQQPLAMGRNKIVYGHYLLASCRYRECMAYLDGITWLYREKGLWSIRLHHAIIKAICLANTGAPEEAMDSLYEAYAMTHANNVEMCFVEYGSRMCALLEVAAQLKQVPFAADWLRRVRQKATLYAEKLAIIKRAQMKEQGRERPRARLSKREHEVLCLMVEGCTRSEIARELGISVNSVKTHMAGAYSKLGAANKADAIRIALDMGMRQEPPEVYGMVK